MFNLFNWNENETKNKENDYFVEKSFSEEIRLGTYRFDITEKRGTYGSYVARKEGFTLEFTLGVPKLISDKEEMQNLVNFFGIQREDKFETIGTKEGEVYVRHFDKLDHFSEFEEASVNIEFCRYSEERLVGTLKLKRSVKPRLVYRYKDFGVEKLTFENEIISREDLNSHDIRNLINLMRYGDINQDDLAFEAIDAGYQYLTKETIVAFGKDKLHDYYARFHSKSKLSKDNFISILEMAVIFKKTTYNKKADKKIHKDLLRSKKRYYESFGTKDFTRNHYQSDGKDILFFPELGTKINIAIVFDKKGQKIYYFDEKRIGALTRQERLGFLNLISGKLNNEYILLKDNVESSLKYLVKKLGNDNRYVEFDDVKFFIEGGKVESLFNFGNEYLNNMLRRSVDPKRELRRIFGTVNFKGKNIYDTVGLNKDQFEYFAINGFKDVIPIKTALIGDVERFNSTKFDGYSISSHNLEKVIELVDVFYEFQKVVKFEENSVYSDKKTTQVLFNNTLSMVDKPWLLFAYLRKYKGFEFSLNLFKNINDGTFFEEGFRDKSGVQKISHARFFTDAIDIHATLNYLIRRRNEIDNLSNEFKLMFEATNDLFRTSYRDPRYLVLFHDALNNVKIHYDNNRTEEEKRLNHFVFTEEQQERFSKFTYEDEKYSIISPVSTSEIITEGAILNHCVGSYSERVKNNSTNILFLRNNENKNIPLFTIEVSNRKKVRQIYGRKNSLVSSNNDYLNINKFLDKWIKEKKLIKDFNY